MVVNWVVFSVLLTNKPRGFQIDVNGVAVVRVGLKISN